MGHTKVGLVQRVIRSLRYRSRKIYPDYLGDKYQCPLCKTQLAYFEPLPMYYFRELQENQYIHSIFQAETSNIENYQCPVCNSSDRDRLYYLYTEEFLREADAAQKFKLLEIAPSAQLRNFLQRSKQVEYRSADLFMEGVDDKVDITNMNIYADESFDIFICSHVLEHVEDDLKAMRELYRILKPGGWGIAMVPILLGLQEIYEDPTIKSESERWKHFGQNDHVRMYSKNGFRTRLKEAGFQIDEFGISHFGEKSFEKYGIHPRSVLYIVKK
jgi:SAM-dependent methyltransferase